MEKVNLYLLSPWHNVAFPVGENMRRTISMSHSIDNSLAFFTIPALLLEYVTCLPLLFSNFLIFNLTLPIMFKETSYFFWISCRKETKISTLIYGQILFAIQMTKRAKKQQILTRETKIQIYCIYQNSQEVKQRSKKEAPP